MAAAAPAAALSPAPAAAAPLLQPLLEAARANPVGVVVTLVAVAVVYCALEQLQFRWTAPGLPSPPGLFVPLVGGIVDMV